MKELTIEEKAKAYDEALKQIKECTPDENGFITIYPNEIFPELKESEDERIRKSIIGFLITISSLKDGKTVSNEDFDSKAILEWVAWLEKQGEQKLAENSGKKSEDVIEEKDMTEYKKGFECGKQRVLKYPEDFNLCKKPTWSEEDKNMLQSILDEYKSMSTEKRNWLKYLKERYTWKPSELQIEALESATENCAYSEYQDCLRELIGQLKKLMEE